MKTLFLIYVCSYYLQKCGKGSCILRYQDLPHQNGFRLCVFEEIPGLLLLRSFGKFISYHLPLGVAKLKELVAEAT